MEHFIKQHTFELLNNQISNQTIDVLKQQLILENLDYQITFFDNNLKNFTLLNKIFILYLLFQKKLYTINQISYTLQKNLQYFKDIVYLTINLKKNNTFITFCTELKQKIFSYSIGIAKIKTQKKKKSYYTIKIVLKKIKKYILKNTTKKIYIIFKGLKKQVKLYYSLLLKLPIILVFNIKFEFKKLHGGCKLRKKKRK